MSAYAICHLDDVRIGPDILAYLHAIDATLEPHGGRFLVHGATPEIVEGQWPGDLVIVAFPSMDDARAWYRSPAYQAIAALRADNARCRAMLVEGVAPDYRATDVIAKLSGG
jgi:uncharacterized protein (DUF1330 family)